MRKTHSSIRLVIAFLLVTVCIVFASCSCAPETDTTPVNPEVVVESVPTVSDTTATSTTTGTAVDESTTEALSTTSEITTAATTAESKVEESTTRKTTTTTTASTAKTTTTSASKPTTTTTKQTTTTVKPTTTTKKTTTATTTTTTTKAQTTTTTTTTTTKATTTTTTKKASAVWGTPGEMKSDCISIAKGLGYEYDSSLGKSNSHWITPTYSGAFTSSYALKAKIKDALQTYQTVGYTYCNFAFESNGEGEYYIYIFVG